MLSSFFLPIIICESRTSKIMLCKIAQAWTTRFKFGLCNNLKGRNRNAPATEKHITLLLIAFFRRLFEHWESFFHDSFEHSVSFLRKHGTADKCHSRSSETHQLLVRKYASQAFPSATFLLLSLRTTGSCQEFWGRLILQGNQMQGVRSITYHLPRTWVANPASPIFKLLKMICYGSTVQLLSCTIQQSQRSREPHFTVSFG